MTDFDSSVRARMPGEIYRHGRTVQYHANTGTVTDIQAFVDVIYIERPGDYDSGVMEKTTVITMLADDVPNIARDELIVDGSKVYEVVTVLPEESDDEETAVTVK